MNSTNHFYLKHLFTAQAAGRTSLDNVQILRRFTTVQVNGIVDGEIEPFPGIDGEGYINFGF